MGGASPMTLDEVLYFSLINLWREAPPLLTWWMKKMFGHIRVFVMFCQTIRWHQFQNWTNIEWFFFFKLFFKKPKFGHFNPFSIASWLACLFYDDECHWQWVYYSHCLLHDLKLPIPPTGILKIKTSRCAAVMVVALVKSTPWALLPDRALWRTYPIYSRQLRIMPISSGISLDLCTTSHKY